MMPGRAADRRRGAVPRQSATPSDNQFDPHAALFADMHAAMDSSSDQPTTPQNSWFFTKKDQTVLAGPYEHIHVYMTDKNMVGQRKWVYTKIKGTLRLIKMQQLNQYPCVFLRLTGTDEAGIEHNIVFEYELPFNFQIQTQIVPRFSSVSHISNEYLGFLFATDSDAADFDTKISEMHKLFTLFKTAFMQVRQQAQILIDEEY